MPLTNPAMLQLFQAYHQSPLPVFLRRINTVKSVQAQKWHFQRCNNLLFAHSLDFHCAALEATARLGQDQELYDSIKALCIFQRIDGTFHHENILESIDFMIQPPDSFWYHRILDLLVLMTFFKVKLLLDLMRLDVARMALGIKFPREVLDMVLLNIPESPTVTTNRGIMNSTDLIAEITTISAQVDLLLAEVNDRNPCFWNKLALHNPNNTLVERPTQQELSNYDLGLAKDLFLCHVYCWFETPGAIALLRRKRGL
ncbi:hypothetical protein N7454_001738 [Penicillium verhagenii]|nr:hypothetical protein N7454_001738 [Penicillium verhagenii]